MENSADVAVVGLGAMGTAALWRLASRGASVLGFERFEAGHAFGSSHGATRILRAAYHEGAQYVPLVMAALDWWRRLEHESARELFVQTGGLMIGRPDSDLISGTLRSAREHGVPHRILERSEMADQYPQHRLANGEAAVLDELAGVLFADESIAAAAAIAVDRGAEIHTRAVVGGMEPAASHVDIVVGAERFRVRHVIICAGPWLPELVSVPGCEFAIERQVMTWFRGTSPDRFAPGRFPAFVRELADGQMYFGVPDMGDGLVKIGVHHAGDLVRPDSVDRSVHSRDTEMKESFVDSHVEGLLPSVAKATVCMYTNSPDEHFVIGPVRGAPNVTVISPCSGHGFKFAPVIGEIAADLALLGGTDHDISLFSPDRFARTGAAQPPRVRSQHS